MELVSEYYTIAEVAVLFRVSHQAVRRWIRSKRIVSIKTPGGNRLIHRSEIERYTSRSAAPTESHAAVERRMKRLADSLQGTPTKRGANR